ncbi:unnamed protein product, partial [Urochloa humidicola]
PPRSSPCLLFLLAPSCLPPSSSSYSSPCPLFFVAPPVHPVCLVLTPLPIGDGFCEEGRVKCSSSVIKIRAEVVVSPDQKLPHTGDAEEEDADLALEMRDLSLSVGGEGEGRISSYWLRFEEGNSFFWRVIEGNSLSGCEADDQERTATK